MTEDITLYPIVVPEQLTVNFYDPALPEGEQLLGSVTVDYGSTVAESQFPDWSWSENGFEKNPTISSVYTEDYVHKIDFCWFYKNGAKWEDFLPDETPVKGTETLNVYFGSKYVELLIELSGFDPFPLKAPYTSNTRFADTFKDALFMNEGAMYAAYDMSGVEDKILSKLREKELVAEGSKEILNVNRFVKFVSIIGKENLNKFLDDQLDMNANLSDDELYDKYSDIYFENVMNDPAQFDTMYNKLFDKLFDDLFEQNIESLYDEYMTDEKKAELFAQYLKDNNYELIYDNLTPVEQEAIKQQFLDNLESKKDAILESQDFRDYAKEYVRVNKKEYIKTYINDNWNKGDNIKELYREDILELCKDLIEQAKDDYVAQTEAALVLLKQELANEEQFTVNEDTELIVRALGDFVRKMTFEKFKSQYLTAVPDKLLNKIPLDIIEPIFERSRLAYYAQIEASLDKCEVGNFGEDNKIDCGVTVNFNPISEVLIPLYEYTMDKYESIGDELAGRNEAFYEKYNQYYAANPYNDAIVRLTETDNWFSGTANSYTEYSSGYSFKDFEDYYKLLQAVSVLVDDSFVWYCKNVDIEDINAVLDKYDEKILYYANFVVGLINGFAQDGIPTSFTDLVNQVMIDDMIKNDIIKVGQKVTDKDIDAYITKLAENAIANNAYSKVMTKFEARLLVIFEKISESRFSRVYDQEDFERGKEFLNFLHEDGNANVTTDYVFDEIIRSDSKIFETTNNSFEISRYVDIP